MDTFKGQKVITKDKWPQATHTLKKHTLAISLDPVNMFKNKLRIYLLSVLYQVSELITVIHFEKNSIY
jgi:hypothetical protein